MKKETTTGSHIVIAAGGTGGHIFPALSVALELRRQVPGVSLEWIGTSRSREVELCRRNDIPITVLDVQGIKRALSLSALRAVAGFVKALAAMLSHFATERPRAVCAFGGYVCAPVLAAAALRMVPWFLHEQNTVPGLVNRLFSRWARRAFLGFPHAGRRKLSGRTVLTGTPVRRGDDSYAGFAYPEGFDRRKKTVLICGGSQGAASMNERCVEPVKAWRRKDITVLWQTGAVSHAAIKNTFADDGGVFVFETLDDLYPYYAVSKLVVGRAGASTIAEAAYFGLPCVLIPLPWAAENHQWVNAGVVQAQGWGIRVEQDDDCGANLEKAVAQLLTDEKMYNAMSMKALDNSPADAAANIVSAIVKELSL
jgi:UDP-N-acetylglucosamine--N-acetylmuramyl-(pentapeptide) pyrophosphoryl-undecaprenol N-acetylglucosamine transferase